jgi:hypothetical protein
VGSDALQLNSRYASVFLKTAVSSSEAESVRSFDNLKVTVEGGNIVVTLGRKFKATYYKPAGQPQQLILRERSKSDDDELLAAVLKAANDKARKMGWIV